MKPTCTHGNANGPCNVCRTERIHAIQAARAKRNSEVSDEDARRRFAALNLAKLNGQPDGSAAIAWAARYLAADSTTRRAMVLEVTR